LRFAIDRITVLPGWKRKAIPRMPPDVVHRLKAQL
jgi:hypothetical protein